MRSSSRLVLVLLALALSACDDDPATRKSSATPEVRRAAPPAPAPPASRRTRARVPWTHDTLLRRLPGRRIRVAERTVRLDGDTIACAGVGGAATQVSGEPAWTRFRCVQPTFPPGTVAGPDAIFFVEPTGPRTLVVTGRRFSRY